MTTNETREDIEARSPSEKSFLDPKLGVAKWPSFVMRALLSEADFETSCRPPRMTVLRRQHDPRRPRRSEDELGRFKHINHVCINVKSVLVIDQRPAYTGDTMVDFQIVIIN